MYVFFSGLVPSNRTIFPSVRATGMHGDWHFPMVVTTVLPVVKWCWILKVKEPYTLLAESVNTYTSPFSSLYKQVCV